MHLLCSTVKHDFANKIQVLMAHTKIHLHNTQHNQLKHKNTKYITTVKCKQSNISTVILSVLNSRIRDRILFSTWMLPVRSFFMDTMVCFLWMTFCALLNWFGSSWLSKHYWILIFEIFRTTRFFISIINFKNRLNYAYFQTRWTAFTTI